GVELQPLRGFPPAYQLEYRPAAHAERSRHVVGRAHGQHGDRDAAIDQPPRDLSHRAIAARHGHDVGPLVEHPGPALFPRGLEAHAVTRVPGKRHDLARGRPGRVARIRIVNQRDAHDGGTRTAEPGQNFIASRNTSPCAYWFPMTTASTARGSRRWPRLHPGS